MANTYFSIPEALKSKIKVPTNLSGGGESLFPGLQTGFFLLCSHMAKRGSSCLFLL